MSITKRVLRKLFRKANSLLKMQYVYHHDWANLSYYQKENTELLKKGNISNKIVFMGDSITEFWKEIHPVFFNNENFINRGISGQTTPQMLLRFQQDVIQLKPKIVVILAGINDIAGNAGPSSLEMIMDNIKSMSEIARANGIKVILCSVLPANRFSWQPDKKPTIKVAQLNKEIKAYAKDNHHEYADYYANMVDSEEGLMPKYGDDGVHPNIQGYTVMEPIIKEALSKIL